jgi:2-C-methyl-D-erythritol 4-phosphate cytidylyltransferase
VRVAAVVVAGGRGERFGGPKQFVTWAGHSVAAHSVAAARHVAETVVLVVPEGYDGDGEGADIVVTGGASRAASVRAGLAVVGDPDIVVVHDAVRPAASPALFDAVVAAVVAGAAAAVPGLAVTDTVKRVRRDGTGRVLETLRREELVTVQTPQAFQFNLLVHAHAGGAEATDDAALVEALGECVVIVAGEPGNVKVTTPDDLSRLGGAGQ